MCIECRWGDIATRLHSTRMITCHVSHCACPGIAGGSLGDPVLSVRRACANAASEVACSTESLDANDPTTPRVNPAQLKFLVETPGTYYVIVDGRDVGDLPTFRLELSAASAAADLGTSDLCDYSTPELPFNPDGVTSFAVSLDRATDAVSPCVHWTTVYRGTRELRMGDYRHYCRSRFCSGREPNS